MLDGFYVAYMTAAEGYGVVMLVFKGDTLTGVDAGGVKFDGKFSQDAASGEYQGTVRVDAPPNITLVQGIPTGPNGLQYSVPFSMPENFLSEPFITLSTPFGVVNFKMEKLRDFPAE